MVTPRSRDSSLAPLASRLLLLAHRVNARTRNVLQVTKRALLFPHVFGSFLHHITTRLYEGTSEFNAINEIRQTHRLLYQDCSGFANPLLVIERARAEGEGGRKSKARHRGEWWRLKSAGTMEPIESYQFPFPKQVSSCASLRVKEGT